MVEDMKDCGIPWIGCVPYEWQLGKIKHRYDLTLGKMVEADAGTNLRNESVYVCAANIKQGGIDTSIKKTMYFTPGEKKTYSLQSGDLLITEGGSVGTACVYDDEFGECYFQNSVVRARGENQFSNRYLMYWLEFIVFSGYLDVLCNKATISHYTKEKIGNTPILLVSLKEQQQIVQKLDGLLSEIESKKRLIGQQIDVLEQYKRSLIHEVVTKGLDSTVPTKPSGVQWIGEIPNHWSVNRLKYLTSFESGATPSKDNLDFWDGRIPWVSSAEVKTDVITDTSLHISDEAVRSCSTTLMPEGSLVMVVRSGILQHTLPVAILGKSMTINQDIKGMRFGRDMLAKYFFYFVRGNNDNLLKALMKDKSTVDNVSQNYLSSLVLPVPPLCEQEAIIESLDARCARINEVLNIKRRQVEALKRRRQSLVYEYVTGKRRVGEDS